MNCEKLCNAIKKIAWGYILIHVNFSLNTLNILPDWAGYLLFLSAIPMIGEEDESTNLLIPLGKMICAAEVFFWGNEIFGNPFNLYLIEIVASVLSLYFHFQLLTNLANVARKYECSQEKKILCLRTVKTILLTIFAVFNSLYFYISNDIANIVFISLAIVYLVIAIWICKVLLAFKNELYNKMKMAESVLQEEVITEWQTFGDLCYRQDL